MYKYREVYSDMDESSTFTLRAIGYSNFACLKEDNAVFNRRLEGRKQIHKRICAACQA
jgi:hypothetical protein